jgi:hypothetical protein
VKRLLVLGCAVLGGVAQAQGGYALDQPEIYAAQRVWGIAHGARLLALACAQAGQGAAAEAWVAWSERELPLLREQSRVLARHYFDAPAAPAAVIAVALGLKPTLDLSPEQLDPACATLAETLGQPRYDLARRREELLKK